MYTLLTEIFWTSTLIMISVVQITNQMCFYPLSFSKNLISLSNTKNQTNNYVVRKLQKKFGKITRSELPSQDYNGPKENELGSLSKVSDLSFVDEKNMVGE